MIDYIKIKLLNIDRKRLESLPYLEFKTEVSEKTGLLAAKKIAMYHYCKITIYDSGLILFTGSIHKLHNSLNEIKAPNYKTVRNYKGYNGNIFTLDNILEINKHLCLLFDCKPNKMIFQNIEFGINTTPDFCPQLFITGLLFNRGLPFEFKFKRRYAEVLHNNYRIKIYNKSEQYGISKHTLRIEIAHKKSIDFNTETGIKTFEDINKTTLNKALHFLLKRFERVVYYDKTINKSKLIKSIKKELNNYSDITYWLDTLKPNKRDKPKKKLKQIIIKHSENLHEQLRKDLIKKGVIINRKLKTPKRVIINHSYSELNTTPKHLKQKHISN
ncbi:hypothetical protein ACFFU1_14215 [Algibacter miyuki]|uniref:Uncharacterized protein n=1 Tax=Algibacter miyuki TaxID=1306933 RepID=A0ABV5H2D3_9FLAO|nr:hypothetical protein [Algibacter miyuki]MDN3664462.1 hypothetical protein [Algibacter miyuki]MDN3665319.1 hypothetical protein [Algibacter miyuki]MDN3665329.1 hypothetical protein [Algibacter miyuki]